MRRWLKKLLVEAIRPETELLQTSLHEMRFWAIEDHRRISEALFHIHETLKILDDRQRMFALRMAKIDVEIFESKDKCSH